MGLTAPPDPNKPTNPATAPITNEPAARLDRHARRCPPTTAATIVPSANFVPALFVSKYITLSIWHKIRLDAPLPLPVRVLHADTVVEIANSSSAQDHCCARAPLTQPETTENGNMPF